MQGPQIPFCDKLHAEKYRAPGESFRESQNRVSAALQDNEEHYHSSRAILLEQKFMPAGRIQTAMGSTKNVTPYNCYVSGTIEDSFVDGTGSIMDRAKEAAATMRMGGGIGYDFSTLRPNGALIKKLQSRSSGPINFMEIYDAICRCIASSGHRRGAQMGVLRIDHPDIEQFIHAKQNLTHLTGFNISIAVTDAFMNALLSDDDSFDLIWAGQVFKSIRARALWENIMRSTWDWGEPGVLFIDTINHNNNLSYCETIAATNPCGEQPLPPHGACLLGSWNMVKYVDKNKRFDYAMLAREIPTIVRMMDNVIDRAIYPLYEQEKEAKSKRRMGLGVTGMANALEYMDMTYGSNDYVRTQSLILQIIANETYKASATLAKEKGSFPLYDKKIRQSPFIQRLDEDTQKLIKKHGLRNSHLLSIAPTGTISLCADNISSGIEPVFEYSSDRIVNHRNGSEIVTLEDYGYRTWGVEGKTTEQVSISDHLAVLESASFWVDSAVSKTCNVPPHTPWEEFKEIYIRAWKFGAKGITTFNKEGKRMGILKKTAEPESSCRVDLKTGKKECD